MLEKDIEAGVVKDLESIGCFVVKFQDLSRRGAPDRLVILPNGVCIFLELKTPVGKLSPHQLWYHSQLAAKGVLVFVVDSLGLWAETFSSIKGLLGDHWFAKPPLHWQPAKL